MFSSWNIFSPRNAVVVIGAGVLIDKLGQGGKWNYLRELINFYSPSEIIRKLTVF